MAAGRAMPLRAKVISLVAMWLGVGTSCFALAGVSVVAQAAVVGLGLTGTAVLLLWMRTLPAPAVLAR